MIATVVIIRSMMYKTSNLQCESGFNVFSELGMMGWCFNSCLASSVASRMDESCLVPSCLGIAGMIAMRTKLRTLNNIHVSRPPTRRLTYKQQ